MKKKRTAITRPTEICTSTPGLPVSHHCYNCPLARMYGDVVFCYTPGCFRGLMNDIVTNRKEAVRDAK